MFTEPDLARSPSAPNILRTFQSGTLTSVLHTTHSIDDIGVVQVMFDEMVKLSPVKLQVWVVEFCEWESDCECVQGT